jgi:predicted secreted protein
MSEIGYNGRVFKIKLGATVIAAVQSKTATHAREGVDVTNDDSNGWRILLPDPGVRSMDVSIEGVATEDNYQVILDEWLGIVNSNITIQHADGSTATAQYGFFLGSVEFSGSNDGHVAFTASLQSSGEVTITPAP